MKQTKKLRELIKWTTRILSIFIILFGLSFYFGYGNPLPFRSSNFSLLENIWLTLFPIIFINLGIGLKYPKVSGYILTITIILAQILTLILEKEIIFHMLLPLVVGILNLILAHKK